MPRAPQRRVRAVGRDQLVVGAELVTTPPSITATRSASCAVCSRCAIAMTVRPGSTAASARSVRRAVVGSSSGGRLVQDHRVRVGEHHPGQRELLGLGAVERCDRRRRCPGRRGRRPSRAPTASSAARSSSSVAPGAATIRLSAQRLAEDVVLLGDQHDLRAQPLGGRGRRSGRRRRSPCRYAAGRPRRAAGPSVDLPAPDRPDDRQPLARPHREVDAVQHVAALVVGVPHAATRSIRSSAGFGVVHRSGSSQPARPSHPGERGAAALQLLDPHQHDVQRRDQLPQVERGRDHRAQRHEPSVEQRRRAAAPRRPAPT